MMRHYFSGRLVMITAVFLVFITVGCANWQFIAGKDPETIGAVDRLHDKIYAFIVKMNRYGDGPEGEYRKNAGFYDEVRIDLEALRFRAMTRMRNEKTVAQIDLLADTMRLFEEIHKEGLTKPELIPIWKNISQQLRLINTLEKNKPVREE